MDATQALTLIIIAVIVRDGLLGWALINWVIRASTPAVVPVPDPGRVPDPGAPPAPVPVPIPAPPPAPPSPRFTGITATSFGGAGDANASAYGGMVDPDKPGFALPYRFTGTPPTLRASYKGKTVDGGVVDIGPWYDGRAGWPVDPYWQTGTRPHAEADSRTNSAGIDLTPAAWTALGMSAPNSAKAQIDWDFVSVLDATATTPTTGTAPTTGTPPWITLGRTFTANGGLVWADGQVMPPQIQAWMDNIATKFPNQAAYVRALKTIGAKGYWEWCGGFVASMLSYSGIPGPISSAGLQGQTTTSDWAYVDAWRPWGTKVWDVNDGTDINDAPVQTGDVLIWKTSSIHHVSFYGKPLPDTNTFSSLGGDQGNPLRVCEEELPMSWCVAIRRPPIASA